jgi:hypothetical protein
MACCYFERGHGGTLSQLDEVPFLKNDNHAIFFDDLGYIEMGTKGASSIGLEVKEAIKVAL